VRYLRFRFRRLFLIRPALVIAHESARRALSNVVEGPAAWVVDEHALKDQLLRGALHLRQEPVKCLSRLLYFFLITVGLAG